MVSENGYTQLDAVWSRMNWNGLGVDFVRTSAGLIRIGSMPDISKFCRRHGIEDEWVVVPPWQGSMAGDNYTGEEFVLWEAQVGQGPGKNYVGVPADMAVLHDNLDHTFSYFFDEDCLKIRKKDWIGRWLRRHEADGGFRIRDVRLVFGGQGIQVFDGNSMVYDGRCAGGDAHPEDAVEAALGSVKPDKRLRDAMEIMPLGIGNGFTGTVSSCLVRSGARVLWIDPGGYPAHTLARHGVHWDDVTDIFITHNHEDHVQGMSAVLFRARHLGRKAHIITAPSIYRVLRRQYLKLCPDFDRLVQFTPVSPGPPLEQDGINIHTRWNHHILPYGTLGLKISARGRTFGFSGDTKLDERINAVLGRPELTPQWFRDCDLVFHEVSFDHPMGVHSHWKEVKKLQAALDCPVLGYHTDAVQDRPLALAGEGKIYRLE